MNVRNSARVIDNELGDNCLEAVNLPPKKTGTTWLLATRLANRYSKHSPLILTMSNDLSEPLLLPRTPSAIGPSGVGARTFSSLARLVHRCTGIAHT